MKKMQKMNDVVVGIDIGATSTKFGIVDKKGRCLAFHSINTGQYLDLDKFLENLHKEIQSLVNSLGNKVKIRGVGVGAPNGNYFRGTIEHAPNLPWKGIIPFVKKVKRYFPGVNIVLTNDANAAAVGEMMYGGAKKMKNFVVITLGTGLGSAFVVEGQLLYGCDGHAGELGHVNVKQNGRICKCGNKGCLETYVSAKGIKRTFLNLLYVESKKSNLSKTDVGALTSKMICDAAQKGDALAIKAFKLTGEILGKKLSDVVAITNPEAIFMLGGVAQCGDLLFKPTQISMEKNLFPIMRGRVKIFPSKLRAAHAGVLGAGALVWKELL